MGVISENSQVTANVAFMLKTIAAVATLTYGYVTIKNQITELDNELDRMEHTIDMNSEFRIKWPRGELGSLPDDAEQNMRLQYLENVIFKLESHIDDIRFGKAKNN